LDNKRVLSNVDQEGTVTTRAQQRLIKLFAQHVRKGRTVLGKVPLFLLHVRQEDGVAQSPSILSAFVLRVHQIPIQVVPVWTRTTSALHVILEDFRLLVQQLSKIALVQRSNVKQTVNRCMDIKNRPLLRMGPSPLVSNALSVNMATTG
jgi:hypothetical protein